MNKTNLRYPMLIAATGLLVITQAHAGTRIWTYSAPSPATTTIFSGGTATIQYTVTNQSHKSKNLILKATPGLSASSCYLATKGSTCTLTLTVNGSAVPRGGIHTGPALCEQGNTNQCYRPSQGNELQITLTSQPPITTYTGIYVATNNRVVTYSPNNGTSWGYMLSSPGEWEPNVNTRATTVTSDGTMYQATGIIGNGTTGNGAAALIYSSDGVTWAQVASFPRNSDYVQSMFALGNTVYVGTGAGYVYSTSNQGRTWQPSTVARVPDRATVNAIVVDGSGNYYAGTSSGHVYYSTSSGESWIALTNQLAGGDSISSLAIDTTGTLYAVTANTTIEPQYNSAPLTTGTWQTMTGLPAGDGNPTSIAASGSVVYVGTDISYVAYTSNKGQNWNANQLPNDTSGISSLFVNQATSLSPLFVESYGTIPIISGTGTGSITVTNFSSTTASNVQANPSQLPAGVTSSSCPSVTSGGSCTITLTAASGVSAFAPTAFDIIDSNSNVVSRSALVSSVTPDGGSNYYYVYNVNGTTSYVLDNSNASNGISWSSNGSGNYDGGVAIYGISEASTTSSPNPSSGHVMGQTACNGATDGSCDANNIPIQYPAIPATYYPEGLCYQSTNGAASSGDWYLPAACELNGGVYLNVTTNNLFSCSPVLTGISSLYNLGALGGNLQGLLSAGFYWSSTEYSLLPQFGAWAESFASGGGSILFPAEKSNPFGVRCSRALSL